MLRPVHCPEDVEAIAALAGAKPLVVMDSSAWKVIPAENLVATYSVAHVRLTAALMAVAKNATRPTTAMFEALEIGVDGVLLRTDNPAECRKLATYVEGRRGGGVDGASSVELSPATVTRVSATGVGDRACVDCASAFAPGGGTARRIFRAGAHPRALRVSRRRGIRQLPSVSCQRGAAVLLRSPTGWPDGVPLRARRGG